MEKRIEVLTEFVQVTGEMNRCCLNIQPATNVNHSNLCATLTHVRYIATLHSMHNNTLWLTTIEET